MKLTDEQREKFSELAKPMMEFLAQNCHPHTSVSIDSDKAELKEGVAAVVSDRFMNAQPEEQETWVKTPEDRALFEKTVDSIPGN